jgi:hypothetical protein
VLRLLLSHPQVEIAMVTSRQYVGEYLHRIQPSLKGFTDLTFSELDYDKMSDKCDLVFTAVPHGTATEIVKTLYDRGMKIILIFLQITGYIIQKIIKNGTDGNTHIQTIYQSQSLVYQKFTENKSKLRNLYHVLDVWQ